MSRHAEPSIFGAQANSLMVNRMHARHAMLIDAYRHVIADATVLQLGAEDGRWCYSFAAAGALQVVGVEPCGDWVDRFALYPDVGLRERIDMRHAALLEELEAEVRTGRQHDIVAIFDGLEDCGDLNHMFSLIARLRPRIVLGDGIFAITPDPVMALSRPTGSKRGAGHLIPSIGMVQEVAAANGFEVDWLDWRALPEDARLGLDDYFQRGSERRASFVMLPEAPV